MKEVAFYVLCLLLTSCGSQNKLHTNDQLIEYTLKDQFLLKSIDDYILNNFNKKDVVDIENRAKRLVIIASKNINNPDKSKYISHIRNDSSIYNEPISGYFIYKNDTILIYSKKDKYINPWKYPAGFSASMKQQLNDTESRYEQDDGDFLNFKEFYSLDHTPYWRVNKGRLTKDVRNYSQHKLLYGSTKNWGYDYDGKADSLGLKIAKFNLK